jgi:hypothetical protein
MQKRLIYTIWTVLFLTTIQSCSSNNNSHETNSDTSKIVVSSTVTNNNILDTLAVAHGDLNSDGVSDLVIVFRKPGEDTIFNSVPKRPMKIFWGLKNGSYSLFCSSDSVVMTHDMGGASNPDPFDNINVKNGILKIEHHGGMGSFHWSQSVSFKFSVTDKIFYVNKIEKQEGKFSDDPSEAFEKETTKTEKDFGKMPFDKYSVFEKGD